MKHSSPLPFKKESGAVLALALIFLMLFTLIGVTAVSRTGFDERMAANAESRTLAFQAAESALREARRTTATKLQTIYPNACSDTIFFTSKPACGDIDSLPDPNNDAHWIDGSKWTSGTEVGIQHEYDEIDLIANNARYTTELIDEKAGTKVTYTIRARAYAQGSVSSSVVVLEETFSLTCDASGC